MVVPVFHMRFREDTLRNGTHSVAVAKEKGRSGMEGLPVLIACLSASASSMMKPLLLQDGEERKGPDRDWPRWLQRAALQRSHRRQFLVEKNLGFEGGVEKTLGRKFINTLSKMPFPMCLLQWTAEDAATDMLCRVRVLYHVYGGHRVFSWVAFVCFLRAHA